MLGYTCWVQEVYKSALNLYFLLVHDLKSASGERLVFSQVFLEYLWISMFSFLNCQKYVGDIQNFLISFSRYFHPDTCFNQLASQPQAAMMKIVATGLFLTNTRSYDFSSGVEFQMNQIIKTSGGCFFPESSETRFK